MDVTIVCLDGPAGSGKSTIAKKVAKRTGFVHLDTGAIYRSLALAAGKRGIDWEDGAALSELAAGMDIRFLNEEGEDRVFLGGEDVSEAIRSPEISRGSSVVSRHPEVRKALLDIQRDIGGKQSVVAEGRDTGTVVFPGAALKIFLTATLEERARRRLGDLEKRGEKASIGQIRDSIEARDRADSNREVSPLAVAEDAITIDSTGMAPDDVVTSILALLKEKHGS